MTIDYDQAYAEARDRQPFANGTEGETWTANWCDRCLRDTPFRNGITATGCPLILVALTGRTPAQWLEQPVGENGGTRLGDQYHCIEFRAPGAGSSTPRPQPTPPGQAALFDRDDYTSRRMLVQPQSVPVGAS